MNDVFLVYKRIKIFPFFFQLRIFLQICKKITNRFARRPLCGRPLVIKCARVVDGVFWTSNSDSAGPITPEILSELCI